MARLAKTNRQNEITIEETSGRKRAMTDDVLTANKAIISIKLIFMFIGKTTYKMYIIIRIEVNKYK